MNRLQILGWVQKRLDSSLFLCALVRPLRLNKLLLNRRGRRGKKERMCISAISEVGLIVKNIRK